MLGDSVTGLGGSSDAFCALSFAPVNYHTGENIFSSTEFTSSGLNGLTQGRHYVTQAAYVQGGYGPSWRDHTPRLLDLGTQVILVQGSRHRRSWTDNGDGTYTAQNFYQETLSTSSDGTALHLKDEDGNMMVFYSFTWSNVALRGKFYSAYDSFAADGATNYTFTGTTYHPTYNEMTSIFTYEVVGGVADPTTQTSFNYFFNDTGPHTGKVQACQWFVPSGAGAVRTANHTYYDTSGTNGPAGTLQRVKVTDGAAALIETKYYRYNGLDAQGRAPLRMVIEGRSYERALGALGTEGAIDGATDLTLAPYADYQFTYDANLRVTQEIVQGKGTIAFSAPTTSGFLDGVNTWKQKTTETLSDGNQNIVYSNYLGQALFKVFKQVSPLLEWKTFQEHDAQGRVVMEATPSAVTGYSEALADLVGKVSGDNYTHIGDSQGLLHYTEYAATTTATTSTAGDVAGYVRKRYCRNGDGGSGGIPAKIGKEAYTYIRHDATVFSVTRTVYPIASVTRWEDEAGTLARTEGFSYTWQTPTGGTGPSNRIDQKTTTHPVVTTAKNGSNTATSNVDVFDKWSRVTWTKDEDGFIGVTRFDRLTGAVTQRIADVQTTTTTDEPAGWVTPAGGGLHLATNYEFDGLARHTAEIDPLGQTTYTVYKDANWEVRVYPGWNTATNTPTGPTQVSRGDKPGSYDETLTTSIAPAVLGGKPTGAEAIDGTTLDGTEPGVNWFSLSRTFTNTQNQTTQQDSYFNLSGLTYTPGTSLGTLGTHYLRQSYTYDVKGRREKATDATGTIRKSVYDSRDRVKTEWVGTSDANLIKTMEYEYDGFFGIGNGNLTRSQFFTSATTSVDTTYTYDFRDRVFEIRIPGGDGRLIVLTLDNLDRVTLEQTYREYVATWNLRFQTATSYDEKGQVYQTTTWNVDPVNGSQFGIGNSLTTNSWYNARGMQVKVKGPNGEFHKTQVDGARRVTRTFVSYHDAETAYADADDVVNDTVIDQTVTTFDAASNVIQTTRYQRTSTTTKLGDLSVSWAASQSRRTFTAEWFDKANRQTDFVDYGTNGGAAFTRPPTPPAPNTSDNYLVTHKDYEGGGRAYRTTDNKARISEKTFDALDRVTKGVENRVDGVVSETELDTDRTTETVYDSSGRRSQLKAKNPKGSGAGVEDQVTTYVYGTDANQATPAVFRNDLLVAVIYPDSDDTYTPGNPPGSKLGNGVDGVYDREEPTYDYASRKSTFKDPRGVVRTYGYELSLLVSDSVTTLPGGVDGSVMSIGYRYDDIARPNKVTSYSDVAQTQVVNEVKYTYDGWGNRVKREDSHVGAVVPGTTPSVQEAYADGGSGGVGKYVRLATRTYPNGRVVNFNYPAAGTVGDHLSRVDNVANDATGTLKFAQYTYLGMNVFGRIDHPQVTNGLRLEVATGGNPVEWDRFGRVLDQRWKRSGATFNYDRYQYTYDRTSNRLTRDVTPNSPPSGRDEYYVYDGLDRLTKINRGNLASGVITDANANYTQNWSTLESHGNWRSWIEDTNGGGAGGATTQARTHNKANETQTVSGNTPDWVDPAHDRAGNMTTAPQPVAESTALTQTYDGWNRLVKVQAGATTLAEYQYDGEKRRIVKLKPNGANWDRRDYYYNMGWQAVEERELLNTASKTTVATVPKFQWVWCLRYIDAAVLRDENKDGDNDCIDGTDERLYYTQDANFNTTALISTGGAIVERYVYDPYGRVSVLTGTWTTQSPTIYRNEVLFAGYRQNPETGLYQVRNREYHPTLGRWIQRDPIGYHDGMNFYEYVRGSVLRSTDPLGLSKWWHNRVTQRSWINKPIDPGNPLMRFDLGEFAVVYAGAHTTLLDHGDSPAKDGNYRLWSTKDFRYCCDAGKLVKFDERDRDSDVGLEGGGVFRPAPGVWFVETTIRLNASTYQFNWGFKGRPHRIPELQFQAARPRTSKDIWHFVRGRIWCEGDVGKITIDKFFGSKFPSHVLFVDENEVERIKQGVFTDLWVPDGADPTLVVRGTPSIEK